MGCSQDTRGLPEPITTSRDSIHTGTKSVKLVTAQMYLTHHMIFIEPHSHFYHLYVLLCYSVVYGFEHCMFHLLLHKLISSFTEELGIKVVFNRRVQVPEDDFPIDSTEFDANLLIRSSLHADLVVHTLVASRLTSTHRSVLQVTPITAPLCTLAPECLT